MTDLFEGCRSCETLARRSLQARRLCYRTLSNFPFPSRIDFASLVLYLDTHTYISARQVLCSSCGGG
jgi:hypothetical protein